MGNDETTKAYNDHNVYILGAGFAAEAGLPLIRDFMNQMRDAAAWLEEQDGRERERQAIDRVLKFRLSAAGAAYRVPLNVENVEELFSLASASGGKQLTEDMTLAIAATLDYARNTAPLLAEHQYFGLRMFNVADWKKPPNWRPLPEFVTRQGQGDVYGCPPYEFYLGVMCGYFNKGGRDRRDTIITFNYDTVVEDSLDGLGVPFSYGAGNFIGRTTREGLRRAQPARDSTLVLKLHGSVNWCAPDLALTKLSDMELDVVSNLDRMAAAYESYSSLRERGHTPILVAPTWQKALSGPLSVVWDEAVAALQTATRVIILGYSIPTTDQHFRYLLAAGLQQNISLRKVFFVNPALAKQEERTQLEEKLFGLFRREHFDQGIIELVPTDVREFLAGPRNMNEISWRVRIGRPLNAPGNAWGTDPWTFDSPLLSGLSVA